MNDGSTRIDHQKDIGTVDVGYHYDMETYASTPTPSCIPTSLPATSTPSATPNPQYTPVILQVPNQYSTIQSAIDAASYSDTILVAPGTYSGSGNTNISLRGKRIYLTGQDAVIDCEFNSRAFKFCSGESRETVLQDFFVINGSASWELNDEMRYNGGALLCTNESSPTIRNCVFL